jgi:hypothetical protein
MQHDPRAWLWDVRLAADSIATFVHGRSFADYAADLMLRSAVERQFEIAGEALNLNPAVAFDLRAGFAARHNHCERFRPAQVAAADQVDALSGSVSAPR